jgi:homeobox protein DLX1/4/6
MTTIPEGLNSPVSGKTVFMEFGPPSQQMSPSSMSHGHYPMHCLHSAGHPQHDSSYSPASSFPRSLAYPYVNSVGGHSTSPYLSTVQSYHHSPAQLSQTRLEDPGESLSRPHYPYGGFSSLVRTSHTAHGKSEPDVWEIRLGNYLLRNAINNVCN